MISSVSPLSNATKGCVQRSPIGKLNLSFCCQSSFREARVIETILRTLGVRSACRNTVTFAFRTHVGESCDGVFVAGSGLSVEDDTLMHNAAKISAALSATGGLVVRYVYGTHLP